MADTKISALTALTGAGVTSANDLLAIVDTSATTTKKITIDELSIGMGLSTGTALAALPDGTNIGGATNAAAIVVRTGGTATNTLTIGGVNVATGLVDGARIVATAHATTPTLVITSASLITCAVNGTLGATTPSTAAVTTLAATGVATFSANGAASAPGVVISGVPFAGGTSTTAFPLVYINDPAATASTVLTSTGTAFGVNVNSSATDLANMMVDGASRFKVTGGGITTIFGAVIMEQNSAYAHAGGLNVWDGGAIGFSSTSAASGTADAFFRRKAAASIQLGVDAAGVTNQFLTAASRITSDGVGANLTIAGGNGRGGAGGSLILSYYTTAGAATIGTLTTAMTITTTGAIILAALPTADPAVSGQLYKTAGAVMQSA